MTSDKRAAYELREAILKLLTDEEVAKVSTAEAAAKLAEGDEYVDLEKLDEGVCRVDGDPVPTGRLLPRGAVRPATWSEILSELAKTTLPT